MSCPIKMPNLKLIDLEAVHRLADECLPVFRPCVRTCVLAVHVPKFWYLNIMYILQCTASDLEYYVRECGEIMGVTGELPEDSPSSTGPMGVLDHVFKRLIRFKMLDQVCTFYMLHVEN